MTVKVMIVMTTALIVVMAKQMTPYYKVEVIFPSMDSCLLGEVQVNSSLYCGVKCLQLPACHLFCLTGSTCQLYSARVSLHYPGVAGTTPTRCYTSWGSPKDVAHTATITASPEYAIDYVATNVVKGFFCPPVPEYTCFLTEWADQPQWVANFGTPRHVSTVRIQVKDDGTVDSGFWDVEVRVGNDTSTLANNQLIGHYPNVASMGEVLVFSADPYVVGSAVSIQSLQSYYLDMCGVQIFEY